MPLTCPHVEQHHAEEDEEEVKGLGAKVFLLEDKGTEKEGDKDAAAPHEADDGNHGTRKAEGIEIGHVGSGEEEGDEDDDAEAALLFT